MSISYEIIEIKIKEKTCCIKNLKVCEKKRKKIFNFEMSTPQCQNT